LDFLDRLGKETTLATNATTLMQITTRLLGEHLKVSICAYADMEPDQDHFTIRGAWSAPGSASIVGYYSLADFGRLAVSRLRAGLPLVINDNRLELAPEEAQTFLDIGIAATICMPLVKHGQLTALMAIHDKRPRNWTQNDHSLLLEVTGRCWAHIERIRSEEAARASEEPPSAPGTTTLLRLPFVGMKGAGRCLAFLPTPRSLTTGHFSRGCTPMIVSEPTRP
jgi:GAF domain-containing protein